MKRLDRKLVKSIGSAGRHSRIATAALIIVGVTGLGYTKFQSDEADHLKKIQAYADFINSYDVKFPIPETFECSDFQTFVEESLGTAGVHSPRCVDGDHVIKIYMYTDSKRGHYEVSKNGAVDLDRNAGLPSTWNQNSKSETNKVSEDIASDLRDIYSAYVAAQPSCPKEDGDRLLNTSQER